MTDNPGSAIKFASITESKRKANLLNDLRARRDRLKSVGLTKDFLGINDNVLKVWTAISEYVVRKLESGNGVRIPGLGTFGYEFEALDQSPQVLFKRPRMRLASYLLKGWVIEEPELNCGLPISHMDINEVAQDAEMELHVVDGVISEVLQVFAKALVSREKIEFPFPNLGKLYICHQEVKFKFYMDFCLDLNEDVLTADVDLVNLLNDKADDWNLLKGRMTPLELHYPMVDFFSVLHVSDSRNCSRKILCQSVKKLRPLRVCADELDGVGETSSKQLKNSSESWLRPDVLRNYYAISFKKSSNNSIQGPDLQSKIKSEGRFRVVPAELLFQRGQDFVI